MPALDVAAPNFVTKDANANEVSLLSLRGKKVVLYFYPKDNTSGCTAQACAFRDNYSRFTDKNTTVLGVSPDSAKSHNTFRLKHELPFTLLLDEDKAIATAYGVWKEKSMYGRTYMGIERSTFVIDEQGVLRARYLKVKVPGHIEQILANL